MLGLESETVDGRVMESVSSRKTEEWGADFSGVSRSFYIYARVINLP